MICNQREARRILAAMYEARRCKGEMFLRDLEEMIVAGPDFIANELGLIARATEADEYRELGTRTET
jgi:hypothetical protein